MSKSFPLKNSDQVLSYGDYSLELANVPESSVVALMSRTFAHIMQNEASAARGRWAAERDEDGSAKYGDAELATILHDWRERKIDQILSGELGIRQSGPRGTSDERELVELAEAAIIARAKAQKVTLPKRADKAGWKKLVADFLAHPVQGPKARAELARRREAAAAFTADEDDLSEAV